MRGSSSTTRMVATTATILDSFTRSDGALVRRRGWRSRRWLSVRLLVPLLQPLFDSGGHTVAVATALVAPSAAPHHHASEERKAKEPEDAEDEQQEEEDSEEAESAVPAIAIAVVAGRCGRAFGDVGRQTLRPADVVGDRADRDDHDQCHQESDQTETASHIELLLL